MLASSNETNVNNEKIADHSALLPMKSLGSYVQLDKNETVALVGRRVAHEALQSRASRDHP
jgi:hypothetical protein